MTTFTRAATVLTLTLVATATALTTTARSQDDPLGLGARDVVAARAALMPGSAVEPGGLLSIRVELSFRPGWHVYANPAGVEMFRPTVAGLGKGAPAAIVNVEYPPGVARPLEDGSGQVARVYEKTTVIVMRVRLSESARPGPMTLPVELRHQACNDSACLPPKAIALPLALTVRSRGGR
jgi:DsbC/DsbD-like thiol-disulfide interchange protein